MVRRYRPDPVPDEVIETMLTHAVRAPSAGFSQGWAFLVLDTPADVDRFWSATNPDPESTDDWLAGMRTAPALIVPLSNREVYLDRYTERDKGWTDRDEARWPVPFWHMDAAMASLLILLTAVDEGIGGCFFGIPSGQVGSFRTEFGVPADWMPVGGITVGTPAPGGAPGSPHRRARKPLGEVVHRGSWAAGS